MINIGNRTSCRPIRSVIILVTKQIGLPLRGRPILLITRMITNRIGLHSVVLPSPVTDDKGQFKRPYMACIDRQDFLLYRLVSYSLC